MSPLSTVLVSMLSPAILAQTFVVDVNNGPGTNYTSLTAAVAAVPDGATLIVRSGVYGAFSISGKGLTVLGEPGALIASVNPAWGVEIVNTGPGQRVVIEGLYIFAAVNHVFLRDCAGPVLLEEIEANVIGGPHLGGVGATISVSSCDQVMLREVTGHPGRIALSQSNTVLEGCSVRGPDAYNARFGQISASSPALEIVDGTTTVSASELGGGAGINAWLSYPDYGAIVLRGQLATPELRVLGDTTLTAGAAPFTQPTVPVIEGTGVARIDPGVTLVTSATPAVAVTIQSTVTAQPDVRGTSAGPGGALTAETSGPLGNFVILVLGLPGHPLAVPSVADSLWLDPSAYAFAAIGTPQQGTPLTASVAVPSNPTFRGVLFGWQAIAFVQNSLVASNPSWTIVR